MNNIIKSTMTCSALVAAGAMLSACSMLFGKKAEDTTLVPFSTISSSAYSGSLKNWDDKAQPVMCALIRSQLLLATRVIQAPDSAERDQIFTAEKVTMSNGVLQLKYRFNQPLSGATYKIKDFLLLEIPKDRYTTGPVQFIENGHKVCEIGR